MITATAQQAMPSWRPSAPRPSARRPLTVTGAPAASLSRCCISARCGASLGASHTTEQSTLPMRQPSSRTSVAAWRSSTSESAPFHCGSVSGKCSPMSPSPAAPSSASVTAWATASASLCPCRPRAPSKCDAAEHERPSGVVAEAMDVETLADAYVDVIGRAPISALRRVPSARSSGSVILRLVSVAWHHDHPSASGLDQRGVVGGLAARGVGGAQHVGPERLRGLHGHQLGARRGVARPRRRRRPA